MAIPLFSHYNLWCFIVKLFMILFSGYCGNLHKSGDKIVFIHAIDLEKRPVVMHPRKYLMLTPQ